MGVKKFELLLVSRVPKELETDKIYISLECKVIIHLCACGCGEKVVLPIDPDGWEISYDGESVTLKPSIGNFQFPCRSHYWIRNNKVEWADMPPVQIPATNMVSSKKQNFWQKLIKRLFKL